MCGIIGILSKTSVISTLINCLKRLEYRGYDSSGIATLENGKINFIRSVGRLSSLEDKIRKNPIVGSIGIGHTRWATHGAPIERNAHPQITRKLAIVHNGIIENFFYLKKSLIKKGYKFTSETDTEVIAHLITEKISLGLSPVNAIQSIYKILQGSFAIAMILKDEKDNIIAFCKDMQLVIGYGTNEMYISSDSIAFSHLTKNVSYLENNEIAILNNNSIKILDIKNKNIKKCIHKLSSSYNLSTIKDKNKNFMQKEIYEQPEAIRKTLIYYINTIKENLYDNLYQIDWKSVKFLSFACCGTSLYASFISKYWFESISNLFVNHDIASEFRYRNPVIFKDSISFFISQSGETADTLSSLKYCKKKGFKTAAIVNFTESTIARSADIVFPTFAGPEISVASTKTFTTQLTVLLCLVIASSSSRGIINNEIKKRLTKILLKIPHYISEALKLENNIKKICNFLIDSKNVLYVGRGTSYPIALEGALKLKEISYIHAEGYAAGELKHGPIALIDNKIPIIIIAPYDRWFNKIISNINEICARGNKVIIITDKYGKNFISHKKNMIIVMPYIPEIISPIVYAIPIQLIAYHTGILLGKDVDKPRNLAKSVTVE